MSTSEHKLTQYLLLFLEELKSEYETQGDPVVQRLIHINKMTDHHSEIKITGKGAFLEFLIDYFENGQIMIFHFNKYNPNNPMDWSEVNIIDPDSLEVLKTWIDKVW